VIINYDDKSYVLKTLGS